VGGLVVPLFLPSYPRAGLESTFIVMIARDELTSGSPGTPRSHAIRSTSDPNVGKTTVSLQPINLY